MTELGSLTLSHTGRRDGHPCFSDEKTEAERVKKAPEGQRDLRSVQATALAQHSFRDSHSFCGDREAGQGPQSWAWWEAGSRWPPCRRRLEVVEARSPQGGLAKDLPLHSSWSHLMQRHQKAGPVLHDVIACRRGALAGPGLGSQEPQMGQSRAGDPYPLRWRLAGPQVTGLCAASLGAPRDLRWPAQLCWALAVCWALAADSGSSQQQLAAGWLGWGQSPLRGHTSAERLLPAAPW